MFDTREDEYLKATQDAQVNTYVNKSTVNRSMIFWNLFLLASFLFIGYLGFNYLRTETTLLNNTFLAKNVVDVNDADEMLVVREENRPVETAVMGVSHTKSDREYLEMLNSMEMDIVNPKELSVSDAIDDVISTSSPKDNSLYTQAISQEIDSNIYHKNSRVILVEKGDTLGSISEKYYGDSMAFDKIIEANEKLNKDSQVIHIGQKLNVPY
jgi:nucleoid-associated protein YgaU